MVCRRITGWPRLALSPNSLCPSELSNAINQKFVCLLMFLWSFFLAHPPLHTTACERGWVCGCRERKNWMTFKIFQALPEIEDLVQELVGECIWYIYALLAYEICKIPHISSLSCHVPPSSARGGCKGHLFSPHTSLPNGKSTYWCLIRICRCRTDSEFVCDWDYFSDNSFKKRKWKARKRCLIIFSF